MPVAFTLLAYRRIGSARLPLSTKCLKKIGVFPIRNHYYEPLFDDTQIKKPLSSNRFLPAIDLNVQHQLSLLKSFGYSAELVDFNFNEKNADNFYLSNGSFGHGDAEYLYQFIRSIRPNKIIEIGSGHSTKIAAIALKNNREGTGLSTSHICIEPYEQPWLDNFDGIEIIRKCVEDCEMDWANELNSGDLLFIDSSHMIRPQGDVLKEYLEILPLLSSGVYIHIHDIFTPKDYPARWLVDNVFFWNEQYLLEALLSNSDRYKVVGALNYLKNNHFNALKSVCPYLRNSDEPGSFYIRVR